MSDTVARIIVVIAVVVESLNIIVVSVQETVMDMDVFIMGVMVVFVKGVTLVVAWSGHNCWCIFDVKITLLSIKGILVCVEVVAFGDSLYSSSWFRLCFTGIHIVEQRSRDESHCSRSIWHLKYNVIEIITVGGQNWLTMLLCTTFRIGFGVLTSGLNSKYSGYFLMLQGCEICCRGCCRFQGLF